LPADSLGSGIIKNPTSVEKIMEKIPHLKDVNKPLDLAQLGTAKFFIIKSFSEENIFKVRFGNILRFLGHKVQCVVLHAEVQHIHPLRILEIEWNLPNYSILFSQPNWPFSRSCQDGFGSRFHSNFSRLESR